MTDSGRGTSRWTAYNDAQAGRPPRALCVELLRLTGAGRGRRALDLGAGAGVETRTLAGAGWRVVAVDVDRRLPARIADLVRGGRVAAVVGDLQDVGLPPAALVHSSLTLSFTGPDSLDTLWRRIRASLVPGAWLGVDFFGPRDDWAEVPSLSILDRSSVEDLARGMDDVRIDEEEWDGPAHGGGVKHWHVVQVVARMPGVPTIDRDASP